MKKPKTVIDLNESDVIEEYPEPEAHLEPSLFEEENPNPRPRNRGWWRLMPSNAIWVRSTVILCSSLKRKRRLASLYAETRDRDAAYKLITSNLRLVVKIALDFQKFWMRNLLDLIQEGNIGLMQAIKKFDPYRGIKLSYYASFWIKAYILKFIMDNWKLVKIGTTQAQRKLFFSLKKGKGTASGARI